MATARSHARFDTKKHSEAYNEKKKNKNAEFQVISHVGEAIEFFKKLKKSIIFKPDFAMVVAEVYKSLMLKKILNTLLITQKNSKTGLVIIEKFIEGKELSIEILSQNGIHNILAMGEKNSAFHFESRVAKELL